MISINFSRTTGMILRNLLGAGLLWMAFAPGSFAQEQTRTEVETGAATQEIKVERGVVVYVSGNDVVIKGEDGRIRDYPDVPETARVTVDGQELSVHDVQPGMTIEQTTITTTTPRVITTIKSVTGTIWQVTPPTSAILTLENGKNQQFAIPPGTKFTIDGQRVDAFSLRPGMKVSATAVTEVPETVVTSEVTRTGFLPPPPPEPIDADIALLVIVVPVIAPEDTTSAPPEEADSTTPVEEAVVVPAEEVPAELPHTGSSLPLVGLLGEVFCCVALGLKVKRALNN